MTLADKSRQMTEYLAVNQDLSRRLEYSSFILEDYQVMYLDTPKTGCTSIKLAICRALDTKFELPLSSKSSETNPEMFVHDRQSIPVKSLMDLPPLVQREVLFGDTWKRFCVVRNPYDRIFSAWFSKVLLQEPGFKHKLPNLSFGERLDGLGDLYHRFEKFIDYLTKYGTASDPHWDTQYRQLLIEHLNWSAVLRFENLANQLREFEPHMNGLRLNLPVVNESGFRPDWRKISTQTQEAIRTLYEKDFQEFGYGTKPNSAFSSEETADMAVFINAIIARNKRLEQMFSESDELRNMQQVLLDELKNLRDELRWIYQSRSWKWTSIFRKITASFQS